MSGTVPVPDPATSPPTRTEKISYSEVLRKAADDTPLARTHNRNRVAALRALAIELQKLDAGHDMTPDEREAVEQYVLAALRAGFDPTAEPR